jgi:hypothetical protein
MKKAIATFILFMLCAPGFAADIGTLPKTPYERVNVLVGFGNVVGTDTITIDAIKVINRQTRADVSSTIVASSPAPGVLPGSPQVGFTITAGSDGQQYVIAVRVNDTTTGEKFEGDLILTVSGEVP